jgi:hypothetical protein
MEIKQLGTVGIGGAAKMRVSPYTPPTHREQRLLIRLPGLPLPAGCFGD